MRSLVGLFMALSISLVACSTAGSQGAYFVKAGTVDVHLGPSLSSKITNRIYRQQKVDVFEVRGGWARVSKYYDGRIEGVAGQTARWVPVKLLSSRRPEDLAQPTIPSDPRINGLPKVGEDGLTKADVLLLHRGALQLVETGRCARVEWGDKSVNRADTYYVNCGGVKNVYFTRSDIR